MQAEPYSRAVVVLDYRGSATYADNVELVVGDGAALSVVSLADWADDAVHVRITTPPWAATPGCGTPRSRWAGRWSGWPPKCATTAPAATPS